MPKSIVRRLLGLLEETFRPAMTRPSFLNLIVVLCGWILTDDPHTITATLVATGVAGERHHEAFHRFFSRGSWDPDQIGYWLLRLLEKHLENAPLRVAIDERARSPKGCTGLRYW